MKRYASYALLAALPLVVVLVAASSGSDAPRTAAPEIGQPAPALTLSGADGETYSLEDFKGQYVVLEWLNFGCPYVQRHYGSGNMQALQETYTDRGVVWLSVVSSAPGKQGYYPADEMQAKQAEHGGKQTAILLDPTGEVGMAYAAQTTPHMYVIDPEGTLRYMGGIDDEPRASREETPTVPSYVSAALDAAMAGGEIAVTTSRPYGCSVKYP